MQTVFRVKRRLDEKQLSGLKVAKRRRLEGEVPVILTFAGTTPGNDPKTALSVIRCHQEGGKAAPMKINDFDGKVDGENVADNEKDASFDLTDVDELFKIYDAYQMNIVDPAKASERPHLAASSAEPEEGDSDFVYDIYYLRQRPESDSMCIDFNEEKFKLEQCSPENGELVDDEEEGADAYEDEDSNAEDNPQNDYPDEEDWYSDNGGEIPHLLDDDDYYTYESHNRSSSLEKRMQELNFFGREDSDE